MVIMMFMSSSLGAANALLVLIIHFLVGHDRDVHNNFLGVINDASLVLIALFLASDDHDD
jgi:hypothetical protein